MQNFEIKKNTKRLNELLGRGDKNIKSGGVIRKIRRKIRNEEAKTKE